LGNAYQRKEGVGWEQKRADMFWYCGVLIRDAWAMPSVGLEKKRGDMFWYCGVLIRDVWVMPVKAKNCQSKECVGMVMSGHVLATSS